MRTQKFNDALASASEATSHSIELTYGSNGYPSFGGVHRAAFYGFDTYEEAQNLIKTLGCGNIEQIHYRDGWNLAESRGNAYAAIPISASDYGDDYSEWEQDSELDNLKDMIADADDFETIQTLVSDFEKISKEYDLKDADEFILVCDGRYIETVKRNQMNWLGDTHNYHIAVVINSGDFNEDKE